MKSALELGRVRTRSADRFRKSSRSHFQLNKESNCRRPGRALCIWQQSRLVVRPAHDIRRSLVLSGLVSPYSLIGRVAAGSSGPAGPGRAGQTPRRVRGPMCPGADVSGGRLPAGSSCKATRLDIDTAGRAVTFERAGPIDTVRLWRQWRAGGRCRRDGDAESD